MKEIIASLLVTSCGARPVIDAELAPFVQQFNAMARAHHFVPREDFDVTFGKPLYVSDIPGFFTIAECQHMRVANVFQPVRIVVNREEWDLLSIPFKHLAIDHELVHCGLQVVRHDPRKGHLMSTSFYRDELQGMTWPEYYDIRNTFWLKDFRRLR